MGGWRDVGPSREGAIENGCAFTSPMGNRNPWARSSKKGMQRWTAARYPASLAISATLVLYSQRNFSLIICQGENALRCVLNLNSPPRKRQLHVSPLILTVLRIVLTLVSVILLKGDERAQHVHSIWAATQSLKNSEYVLLCDPVHSRHYVVLYILVIVTCMQFVAV